MNKPSNAPEEMILGNPKATRLSEQVIVVILELTEQDWKEYPLPKVVHLSGAPAAPVLPMLAKGLAEKGGEFGYGEPLKRLGSDSWILATDHSWWNWISNKPKRRGDGRPVPLATAPNARDAARTYVSGATTRMKGRCYNALRMSVIKCRRYPTASCPGSVDT